MLRNKMTQQSYNCSVLLVNSFKDDTLHSFKKSVFLSESVIFHE